MFLRIAIFYMLTWIFLILLSGVQQATGILPPQIGLAQLGPGVAALLMVVLFRRDAMKITFFSKETPLVRYLLAALIPAGLGLVVFLLQSIVPMETSPVPDIYSNMLLVILWIPLGALGEELGWRGYLHKKLDTRLRGLVSSVLVGLLWMPIHVTFLTQGPVFVLLLALWFIAVSIVIYALVQDIGFSVLVATIFHLVINLINLLVLDVLYVTTYWVVNVIVWAIAAAIVVYLKRDVFLASKGGSLEEAKGS
jgi:uncharacterized protein